MIDRTLRQLAAATGATLVPAAAADQRVHADVVTDSRAATPGSLYVARVGEHADGHAYAAAARDAGAVAALTTRALPQVPDLPCLVVPDTEIAFGQLARAVLDAHPGPLTVVGVTGSSGKTSTKDLLAAVLAQHAPTVANAESFNGEIGVPLTVCRITQQTRILICEMGARGVGHIAYLTRIAPPQIGVVLNVGTAHVGEFGGREQIALAKSELVSALPPDGLAVLNADDPVVAAMAGRSAAQVVLVGESVDADLRAVEVDLDELSRPSFTVLAAGERHRVTLGVHGRHHVGNALAVLAVARHTGMPLDQACAALAQARPANRWRMEVSECAEEVTVVNDAYNANPDSTAAALRAVAGMRGSGRPDGGRRLTAVLGQMLELGADSETEHRRIGALAAGLGIDRLIAVGDGAAPIADGALAAGAAPEAVWAVPDAQAAYELLERDTRRADVVLFKSSRDAGLRWLGDRFVTDRQRRSGEVGP